MVDVPLIMLPVSLFYRNRQDLRQHSLGRGHAFTRLNGIAHLDEHQLDSGNRGQNIELIDVAHVSQPDDFAFQMILPAGQFEAVLFFELGE
jgi:hypothetical protein